MRSSFPLYCVLLCCLLTPGVSECALPVPTVQTVEFYPNGARFVFQVKTNGDFEFTLPGAFDHDSIRFLAQNEPVSLRVERETREEWIPPALVQLKSQLDLKDRDLKLLWARKSSLQQTMAMIISPLPKDFDGKDLSLFIEDAQTMRLHIETELVDLNLGIEKATKELGQLKDEYSSRMPANPGSIVRISGLTDEKNLTFEAHTSAAGWNVEYDMNLDSSSGVIDAKMRARAWQKTGIDVEGDFSFHTRQPSFALTPAEMRPLIVDLITPHQPIARDVPYVQYYRDVTDPGNTTNIPGYSIGASVVETSPMPVSISTLANVTVKGRGSLKGDGTPENVALGKFDLKSTSILVSIPEQSREAWVMASLDAIPEPSLLPGTASLSVDGARTGRARIPEYGPAQTYLPFGMASRLTAKKERLVGKTGSSWTGKGVLEDGYTLEITNGMETEREITVRDRIPLPANEKIVLEVKSIEPEPTERDPNNRLTWKISVKPGETRRIAVEYVLRYPGGDTLGYR